jgi:hypothetical protein
MKTKKTSSSITIKLIITAILGGLGITYIMYKPPVSEVSSYQKQRDNVPKPYRYKKDKNSFSSSAKESDSDAISLTGKKGSFGEHRIGKD